MYDFKINVGNSEKDLRSILKAGNVRTMLGETLAELETKDYKIKLRLTEENAPKLFVQRGKYNTNGWRCGYKYKLRKTNDTRHNKMP